MENHQLKNVISINILLRKHMLSYYYGIKKEVKQTIKQIDTDLKK